MYHKALIARKLALRLKLANIDLQLERADVIGLPETRIKVLQMQQEKYFLAFEKIYDQCNYHDRRKKNGSTA